jgi:hypothetical protein
MMMRLANETRDDSGMHHFHRKASMFKSRLACSSRVCFCFLINLLLDVISPDIVRVNIESTGRLRLERCKC